MFSNHVSYIDQSWGNGPPIHDDEDELELKLRYAAIVFANPDQRNNAGMVLFPGAEDFGRALQCKDWLHDAVVNAELRRLANEAREEKKPNVQMETDIADVRKAMMQIVKDPDIGADKRIKAGEVVLKSYDVGGFGRANTNINTGISVVQNVLRVPMKPRNDEEREQWKANFKAHQIKLVENVRSAKSA